MAVPDPQQILATQLAPLAERYGRARAGTMRVVLKPVFDAMDTAMAASPAPIACKAGCSYCCHYRVQVSAAEAFALADHVRALPEPAQAALRARIAATAAKVAPLSRAQYEATNVPCTFLQAARCSVYAVRPSACRGHHAVDVGACERTFRDPLSKEANGQDPVRHALHGGFQSVIHFAQAHAGHDATAYEMHGAVHAALCHPGAYRRWQAGKVAFAEVRDRKSVAALVAEASP